MPEPILLTRADAESLDSDSPLAHTRSRFELPEGINYLDGNSLGPLPVGVRQRMAQVLENEWGTDLIRSWNSADWIGLHRRVGAKIARLIGAQPGDVHVGDSTSVSLFKTMVAAHRMRPDRNVIMIERGTFPTDGYVAAGVADLLGLEIRWCTPEDFPLDESVGLLSLTHVDFRTGAMYDLAEITRQAHAVGALVQWDLCHSAGAVQVDLEGADADFAVGCTYKYLNGGPGAPAFTWVNPRLHDVLHNPIQGWMGHASPFAMSLDYEPLPGVSRLASGTHPVLALSVLETALDAYDGVDMASVRAQSLSLTRLFADLLIQRVPEAQIVTPMTDARGSQVSFTHPHAYALVQALVARGVIGDYREPGLARFGFAPLYVRHVDVWDAVDQLVEVLQSGEHLDPTYSARNAVT
ncbi:MAG: aminotransferase class V-fold PLP-dependent enzyme [Marmoricola sp.]